MVRPTHLLAIACLFLFPALAVAQAPASASAGAAPEFYRHIGLIVLDPGHGGDDTGAIGPSGAEEKDVALKVALRLKETLKSRLGCEVLLTRQDDRFITLAERTAFANANNADIFISIHANAALSREASGIETFFMSFDATDDEAMSIAEFENEADRLDHSAGEAGEAAGLKGILFDLVMTESHHESSVLAEVMQTSVLKAAGRQDRGVKQAPFAVLNGALMPAVLLEVGFISNPMDERRLSSRHGQMAIAESIADGVEEFKKNLAGKREYVGYGGQAGKKN